MKVKLSKDYSCYPNGYEKKEFKTGDVVEGRTAELALSDKAGEVLDNVQPQVTKPAQPKTRKRPNKKAE